MNRFRPAALWAAIVVSLSLVLLPWMVSAQSSAVPMQPGLSYDPAACNGVTLVGGLYQCQQPPTPIPTPSPTPVPAMAYIDGVPVCPDDDVTWHGTAQRNVDGSIKCTFGHEHGDDPHSLDATLGPMGAWWNSGVEHDISYPWQTLNENEIKHTSYKIQTRGSDARPLKPWYTINGQNYIKAFRSEYHLDGPKGFVMSKYHSFTIEAVICSPDNNCGIARFGGVQDLGERIIDDTKSGVHQLICIYPDPEAPAGQGLCSGSANLDQVRSMAGCAGCSRTDETWYGDNLAHHQIAGVGHLDLSLGVILGHVWSPIHLATLPSGQLVQPDCTPGTTPAGGPCDATSPDPAVRGDYPPHYRQTPYTPFNVDAWNHGSSVEVSALGMSLNGFPVTNGRINASGYTDRYGNVDASCTAASANCVPFSIVNCPPGYEGFRDLEYSQATGEPNQVLNYDVTNPATGRSLLIWPN